MLVIHSSLKKSKRPPKRNFLKRRRQAAQRDVANGVLRLNEEQLASHVMSVMIEETVVEVTYNDIVVRGKLQMPDFDASVMTLKVDAASPKLRLPSKGAAVEVRYTLSGSMVRFTVHAVMGNEGVQLSLPRKLSTDQQRLTTRRSLPGGWWLVPRSQGDRSGLGMLAIRDVSSAGAGATMAYSNPISLPGTRIFALLRGPIKSSFPVRAVIKHARLIDAENPSKGVFVGLEFERFGLNNHMALARVLSASSMSDGAAPATQRSAS